MGAAAGSSEPVRADEGGVSFWTPGSYGSLAAVPAVPGWSIATFNYYDSVSAGRGGAFLRGRAVQAGLSSRLDILFVNPTYVFATPVLGGQASLSMEAVVGPETTSAFEFGETPVLHHAAEIEIALRPREIVCRN